MDATRLRELAVSDTGFVFDPYSGFTFSVNATGRFILEQLKTGAEVEEVVRRLRGAFDTQPSDDLSRDVHEFVLMLREQSLLPKSEPAEP